MPKLLRISEAAERLNVSRASVYRWILVAVSFTATLAELHADAEALASHPVTRDPLAVPRFEHAHGGRGSA
jgi:hypothetical protein